MFWIQWLELSNLNISAGGQFVSITQTVQLRNLSIPVMNLIWSCSSFWYHICITPEISLHSGIHIAVFLFTGGQKWWSSFPPPSAWIYGQRERLSFPVTRVRHAGHLHQPAAHPVTTTTQHWFNWICVWSTFKTRNLTWCTSNNDE